MKKKRLVFVLIVTVISLICLLYMNSYYDPLSRYPYDITETQKKNIVNRLNENDIEYIIEYAIAPEEFYRYLLCNNFSIYRINEYNRLLGNYPTLDNQTIVNYYYFMEMKYGDDIDEQLRDHYYVHDVVNYYLDYPNAAPLVIEAGNLDTYVDADHSVGYYTPKNLTEVETSYGENILLREEAASALENMLAAMNSNLDKDVLKGFVINQGYVSYRVLNEMDPDIAPGTSDYQLGLSVVFNGGDSSFKESDIYQWLMNNASRYGFVCYSDREPYHFRYVGNELAQSLSSKNLTFREAHE